MNSSSVRLIWRTIALLVVLGIVYVVFKDPFRAWETRTSAELLTLCGAGHRILYVRPYYIYVYPQHGEIFRALVTLSCSSLASALSITCMGFVAPRSRPLRRVMATSIAVGLVIFGNIVRIALSIGVGIFFGRGSLILFHDWAGSTFTFIYTLGGFMIMLILLMDTTSPADNTTENHVELV